MAIDAFIGPIVQLFVAPVGKQLGYLLFYNRNVKDLKAQVGELISIKNGLKPKLDAAIKNNEKIIQEVIDWQSQVDKTNEEAGTFKRRCWKMSRYYLSRKAKKMTQDDVVALLLRGEKFMSGIIAYPPPPGLPQRFTTTAGESSMGGGASDDIVFIVNDVLETLKDDEMYIIGIHGINRDDMKELVSDIYWRAKDENQFEDVAIATEHSKEKIQDEIAYFLGLLKLDPKVEVARRSRLYSRLVDESKKLLILADVSEVVDLEAIGIPFKGGKENKNCKIIVTSSNKAICEKMKTQKSYKLVHTKTLLFGSHCGNLFDDKVHTTIRSLIVVYKATGICSFQTEYDDNGHSSMSLNHDFVSKSRHDNVVKIKLKHPDEFLVSVSGYYRSVSSHVVLHSLKFESNKQNYGPFGVETGQPFTSPPDVGKIHGFYIRSSHDSLYAMGLYYEPISSHTGHELRTLAFGPSQGGSPFDDGPYTTVRKLVIKSDNVINSFSVEFDSNGRSKWATGHGTSRGGHIHTVQLDYPGEFIISVSGYIRADILLTRITVIGSLTIETNRNKYGPFGAEYGDFFSFPSNNIGKIVGFHGSSGWYLDKLGAYIEPFPAQNPTNLFAQVGGDSGSLWDDGSAHTTIRQIIIKIGGDPVNVIVHLHVEYDKNGRSEWSAPHGEKEPSALSEAVIKLDYPGEFLISMSGTTRVLYERWCVVSSLKLESNRRTYGPYGDESGDPFSTSPSTSGKIVGFHGNSGIYLNAIGMHSEPFSNSR